MKLACGIILGDSIRKRGGNLRIENFPSFSRKFCREIIMEVIMGMIPLDSQNISESRLKKTVQIYSTEKPMLIGLNAVKDNRMHFGFGKK